MKNYAKILGLLVTAASLASTTAGCIPLTGGRSSASETKVTEELTTSDTTAACQQLIRYIADPGGIVHNERHISSAG